MPRVKALGSKDTQAMTNVKRSMKKLPEKEQHLIRQLNALKALTGKDRDDEFAEVLGISEGRYRYLKRHPGAMKLTEVMLLQKLASQYDFTINFDVEAVEG